MELKTTNKQEIPEFRWGMWVWETPDGQILGDDAGNVMYVFSTWDNQRSVKALADAARYYGNPEGKPKFLSGRRPIDDEELEHQLARHKLGFIPDELDGGALNDEIAERKHQR